MNATQSKLIEKLRAHIRAGGFSSDFDEETAREEIAQEEQAQNALRRSEQFGSMAYRDKTRSFAGRLEAVRDSIYREALERAKEYGTEPPSRAEALQQFREDHGHDEGAVLSAIEERAPGIAREFQAVSSEGQLRDHDSRATVAHKLGSILEKLPAQVFPSAAVERALADASIDDDPRQTAAARVLVALHANLAPEDKNRIPDLISDDEHLRLTREAYRIAEEDERRNPTPEKFDGVPDDDLEGVMREAERRRLAAEAASMRPADLPPDFVEADPRSKRAVDWMKADMERMDREEAAQRPAAPDKDFDSFFKSA